MCFKEKKDKLTPDEANLCGNQKAPLSGDVA